MKLKSMEGLCGGTQQKFRRGTAKQSGNSEGVGR